MKTMEHSIYGCLVAVVVFVAAMNATFDLFGQTAEARTLTNQPATDPQEEESVDLARAQQQMAEQYKLLEDKLFSLYEFERDQNPMRSAILKRAFQQSQENMTAARLRTIVGLLDRDQLSDAESHQATVLNQLENLLVLLESEDRGKRVRDEIKRHQEYLKEVERILRMQRGLRAQAQQQADTRRLTPAQDRAANRTAKLARNISENEQQSQPVDEETSAERDDEGTREKLPDSSSDEEPEVPPEQPSESADENSANEDAPQSTPPSLPDSGPVPSQSPSGSASQAPSQNPLGQRIEAAEQRMRQAQQRLEEAKRDEAIEEMQIAESELAAARKELEEILRQLREEEVGRTLTELETRFRQMLERELRVYEKTRNLDQIAQQQRTTDFEIQCGRLSVEQQSIAVEAERALMVLREDGSSIAFPETVDQLHQDMLQIADRLSAAKTGRITLELQEDVLESLEFLIEALVVTQRDLEAMKQAQGQSGGRPGDKPLVDSLAEIKMLRGLQQRINRRHERYSRLLNDPNELIGSTDDPDLQTALERLSHRQQQLTDIARDIVAGKNQ